MIKQSIHGVEKITLGDIVESSGRYYRNLSVYTDEGILTLTVFGDRENLEVFKAVDDILPLDNIEAAEDLPELLRKQAD